MSSNQLRSWAIKGAEQRLLEIAEEAKVIYAAFPELRETGRGNERGGVATSGATATAPATDSRKAKRPKRKMSAAGRKAIGDAAKRRWAEWRAQQDEGKGAASASTEASASPGQRTGSRDSHVKKTSKKGRSRKKK